VTCRGGQRIAFGSQSTPAARRGCPSAELACRGETRRRGKCQCTARGRSFLAHLRLSWRVQGALNYWARWGLISLRPKGGPASALQLRFSFLPSSIGSSQGSQKSQRAAGRLHLHPPRGNCPVADFVTSARVDTTRRTLSPSPRSAGDGYACSRAPRARTECPSSRMSSGPRTARAQAPRWANMRPPSCSRSRAGRSRGRAKRSPPPRYRS
jgi:hypothetical protein